MAKGMSTYIDQEKDRQNWQKSIQERNRLVVQIKRLRIKTPKPPHSMKLDDLRTLLQRRERT